MLAVVAVVAVIAFGVSALQPSGEQAPEGSGSGDGGNVMQSLTSAVSGESASLPTPIMAQCNGLKLHCAVACSDLTEILIHNASYSYALSLTTKLKEATNIKVKANGGTGRDRASQPTGDSWMTGQFIRCFRPGNGGPRMSAIDCGAAPGTQVYAPVTGEVVLVKKYKLYNKYNDWQVHIRPDSNSKMDVVLIHLTDPSVKAGDRVTGGVTPMAKVRDVYAYIGESMQLKKYTASGDNGNHTHIQVNNAASSEYHGLDDLKK